MTYKKIIILVSAIFLVSGIVYAVSNLTLTNDWHDFYGDIKGAKIGDVITAKNSNGIICGEYIIKKDGKYGFMHVYGCVKSGESISFYYNGMKLPETVIWKGGKEITGLNLTIKEQDSDGDGVIDRLDLCPNSTTTNVDKNGCSANIYARRCQDYDGNDNKTKGKTFYFKNRKWKTYEDYCSKNGKYVYEYTCKNDKLVKKKIKCMCSNGACLA